jgi:serine/threonine protein kinase
MGFSLPDLKANILIDNNSHACLADFGSLTIALDESTVGITLPAVAGGTTQWMSPELLHPEMFGLKESFPTKESDCYALGMVMYEVLSGQRPFAPSSGTNIVIKVLDGKRPQRPQGQEGRLFTDCIWRVLKLCWKPHPHDRVTAKAVLLGLEGDPSLLRPSSEDGDVGADDQSDIDSCMGFQFHLKPHAQFDHPTIQ